MGRFDVKRRKAAALFLLVLCAAMAVSMLNTPEKRTLRMFTRHREALEDEVSTYMERGRMGSELGLTFNYWDGEQPIVEYIAVSRRAASASRYYGFFYSFDGEPVSFQNAGESLTPVSKETWEWSGAGGHYGLVRRLNTNWFYFEAEL